MTFYSFTYLLKTEYFSLSHRNSSQNFKVLQACTVMLFISLQVVKINCHITFLALPAYFKGSLHSIRALRCCCAHHVKSSTTSHSQICHIIYTVKIIYALTILKSWRTLIQSQQNQSHSVFALLLQAAVSFVLLLCLSQANRAQASPLFYLSNHQMFLVMKALRQTTKIFKTDILYDCHCKQSLALVSLLPHKFVC